ncbi:MAG: branched-chain amino acid ABC transporter permease [Xanthobacteraceae bacterium]|nr:MAG: branched-chain amino acid ABC transporter permease [Xanthobacteraceae bacterium]
MNANLHEFFLQQITYIMIFGLLCMSLDLLVGIVGLVSMGHAAFYGLGAYLLILLTPQYSTPSILTTIPLVLGGVAAIALVIGAFALRTSGLYFIMVTLAVGQMFYYFFNDSKLAGGSDGVYLFAKPTLEIGGRTLINLESKVQFFYVSLGVLLVSFAILRLMLESPFGKVIRGIGINEYRTRGLGYDVYFYKLIAFVIAAVFAGLAGVLGAVQYGFVNPSMLGWHMSGIALVTVILGGMGSLIGPVLGAAFIEVIRYALEHATQHWLLLFGSLIIIMVLAFPRGLAGLGEQLAPLFRKSRAGAEAKPLPEKVDA